MSTSTLISEDCLKLHAPEIKSSMIDIDIDLVEREMILAQFVPQPHTLESMDGIPYYDEEFNLPASDAHRATIYFLGPLLERAAQRAGLRAVGDYPIWYLIPKQRLAGIYYPDIAISRSLDLDSLAAKHLLLVLEVVSTERVAKEEKDTMRMHRYNAYNGVPEFVLLYPELDDSRSIVWFRFDDKIVNYQKIEPDLDNCYHSESIPGLMMKVLSPEEWKLGRKVRVWYQGEELCEAEIECQMRQREQKARQQAEKQIQKEQKARRQAEKQVQREQIALQAAEHQIKIERQAAKQAEAEIARLRELLHKTGLNI